MRSIVLALLLLSLTSAVHAAPYDTPIVTIPSTVTVGQVFDIIVTATGPMVIDATIGGRDYAVWNVAITPQTVSPSGRYLVVPNGITATIHWRIAMQNVGAQEMIVGEQRFALEVISGGATPTPTPTPPPVQPTPVRIALPLISGAPRQGDAVRSVWLPLISRAR